MRVLWLNAGLLLPLDKGGKLRTWHLMRHLAARHQVTYLSFADPSASPADLAGMRRVCDRLETVPRREVPKGSPRFYLQASRFLLDPAPYAVAAYRSREYRTRVARLLAEQPYDALVCDFLVPAVNLPARVPCPTLLFTHNVEAESGAATPRPRGAPGAAPCCARSGGGCCDSRGEPSRASTASSRSRRPTARHSRGCTPAGCEPRSG